MRKVLHYSGEVGQVEGVREKLTLYDRLGDLCCGLKAFTTAARFYGLQVYSTNRSSARPLESMWLTSHVKCFQNLRPVYSHVMCLLIHVALLLSLVCIQKSFGNFHFKTVYLLKCASKD